MHQHVQEQAGTPPLEPSSRGAVWGIYRYFCFLLLKTLPSIIFSFLTSWDERKSRNGCTLDVPRGKWFAGVMPGLERRKQQHHRHTHKVRVCELWLGVRRGGCFPPHCPSFSSEISHYESTVVRMNEMLHAKHLAGGWHTHSIEAQITVIVLQLSTKAIHAKSKSTFSWNREGDSFGSHCSTRETFVNRSL